MRWSIAMLLLGGCQWVFGLDNARIDGAVSGDGDDTPGDGTVHEAGPDDVDGDGVPNTSDNCETIENSNQADEDEDQRGDRCDPCPIDADNGDADRDGVGDACDPRPTVAGDRMLLFEGFRDPGLPAGWTTTGTWMFDGKDAIGSAAANATASLIPPTIPDTSGDVRAAFTVIGVVPSTFVAMGVGFPISRANPSMGFGCTSFTNNYATALHRMSVIDLATKAAAFTPVTSNWALNGRQELTATLEVDGQYKCTIDTFSVGGALADPMFTDGAFGAGIIALTGRLHWIMYVDRPPS